MNPETLVVAVIVTLTCGWTGWIMLKKSGLLKGQEKPDCGCGTCATKGKSQRTIRHYETNRLPDPTSDHDRKTT